jgi:hypothetical protein
LVVHVEGATIPGAPNLPEYLKADVYLPPHLVHELPECHYPIAAMVQTFIEEIGVRAVSRYLTAGRKFGWSFTQNKSSHAIPSSKDLSLIPSPVKSGSAHYIFHGRPRGSLPLSPQHQTMPAGSTILSSPQSDSLASSSDEYFIDEPDAMDLALADAAEKIAYLELGLEKAALKEAEYIVEITNLRNELAETCATLRRQQNISNSPSSSFHASPFSSPSRGKQHAVPNPHTPLARFPNLTSNMSPSLFETPRRTKPKQEMIDTTVSYSNLGPATTEFVTAHNLTHFGQIITLIVENHFPTKWNALLEVLSLSDIVRKGLLHALTTDFEMGVARD